MDEIKAFEDHLNRTVEHGMKTWRGWQGDPETGVESAILSALAYFAYAPGGVALGPEPAP